VEHVQLGPWPDLDDGEPHGGVVLGFGGVPHHFRIEHLLVEGVQPGGVVGERGDVVESDGEHGGLLGSGAS
jgi:hypothetical protein